MTTPEFAADATIEVTSLSKWFGQKVAVSDISCSFGPGVTGLLGPNGAGKTTLLRVLTGLLRPSEGAITLFGVDPRRSPSVYRRVALVPEEDAVYPFLTGAQLAAYSAQLAGVARPKRAAARAMEAVNLVESAHRPIAGYSKGMRQRAKVAAALVGDPEILILDEPLNGTDPVQRAHLIELFRSYGAAGRTIVISSHVLAEVERVADRVIAVVDGKLAAAGDIGAIRNAMSDIPFRVKVRADNARRLGGALLNEAAVHSVSVENDTVLHVETRDLSTLGHALPRVAKGIDVGFIGFEPEDESLESVFRYLVHRR